MEIIDFTNLSLDEYRSNNWWHFLIPTERSNAKNYKNKFLIYVITKNYKGQNNKRIYWIKNYVLIKNRNSLNNCYVTNNFQSCYETNYFSSEPVQYPTKYYGYQNLEANSKTLSSHSFIIEENIKIFQNYIIKYPAKYTFEVPVDFFHIKNKYIFKCIKNTIRRVIPTELFVTIILCLYHLPNELICLIILEIFAKN